MPKKSDVPLVRANLRLYRSDWEKLNQWFTASKPTTIVRRAVHKLVEELERRDIASRLEESEDGSSIDIEFTLEELRRD